VLVDVCGRGRGRGGGRVALAAQAARAGVCLQAMASQPHSSHKGFLVPWAAIRPSAEGQPVLPLAAALEAAAEKQQRTTGQLLREGQMLAAA